MNKRDTLSIAPYFGGKGRMAHFIADRLNYDDSDIFVTPFGGMCRVLLNKPRHKIECYNDYGAGVTALMRILSDPVRSVEFIHRLEDETVYSEEEFNKQKAIYDWSEGYLDDIIKKQLKRMLTEEDDLGSYIASSVSADDFLDEMINHSFYGKELSDRRVFKKIYTRLAERLKIDSTFAEEFKRLYHDWEEIYELRENQGVLKRAGDMGVKAISNMDLSIATYTTAIPKVITDMDLAIATYVVFQQSRDGIGKAWSAEKFKTNDQYRRQIAKLFDCAERLEGVEVFQIDAMVFFRNMMFVDPDLPLGEVPEQFQILNEWINNPRVMMYCDPSYISVDDEEKMLDGIDVENVDCVWEAIQKHHKEKAKKKGRLPRNLGKVYAMSFNYDDQEKFLRCIQKAKCRILVSNYDLQLYNKYLNEDTGWHREEFHTTTGVGSKKDNKRVEVIWYNY